MDPLSPEPSSYLTDPERSNLWRVVYVDADAGSVWLEDCLTPENPFVQHGIIAMRDQGWRAVKPLPEDSPLVP